MPEEEDQLRVIKRKAEAKYAVFDQKRKKLVDAYFKAKSPKIKLRALAKVVRQHGEYMHKSLFVGGWYTQCILDFADELERFAEQQL